MRVWALLSAMALSGCAGVPDRVAPDHLGVGTRGVSSYMSPGADDSLDAELRLCGGPVEGGLAAACAQLRSTMRNQPGNGIGSAVRPSTVSGPR